MRANEILSYLNKEQQEAVKTTEGPLLIMAGAGSGKTRVLTNRIAYLIAEKDVKPWNILAITFTNKAANEMKERVIDLVEEGGSDVWVSTFHSLCVRILRRDIEAIGYQRSFTILDTAAQQTLMKSILKDLNIDSKKYPAKTILATISNAKNELIDEKTYEKEAATFYENMVAQCYQSYQRQLRKTESLDFDDLIMQTVRLFREEPDILGYYQAKFQYIHVDEYQDTNHAQYVLVDLLAQRLRNLCVVGDVDQSIYGWRGADMQNILNFEKDYPDAKVILLEQNYRSSQTILQAANSVIENNLERKDKNLWTANRKGDKITFYRAQSERDEAQYVVLKIQENMRKNHKLNFSDFAILYRTNAQSRIFEDTLIKSNIPYQLIGGQKFYDRKEIKDLIAYLNLIANPADDLSFARIVNEPKRGIGGRTLEKLQAAADEMGWSLYEAALNIDSINISGKAKSGLVAFADLIKNARKQADFLPMDELMEVILDQSGYLEALENENSLEAQSRIENLEEFQSIAIQYEKERPEEEKSLLDFLSEQSLLTDSQVSEDDSQSKVTLMTLHAAKGLEFPIVFIIGMEEGLFPSLRSIDDPAAVEEERRLAYVGITRAEEKLYLTNAYSRLLYGRTQANPTSRFIAEMDEETLDYANDMPESRFEFGNHQPTNSRPKPARRANRRATSTPVQASGAVGAEKESWSLGDKVSHKKWGVGTVVEVTGQAENMELNIAFPGEGIKKLLAAFAPIEKL